MSKVFATDLMTEKKRRDLSGCQEYYSEKRRIKKRKLRSDESTESRMSETCFDARQDFRINTFLVIIDKVVAELTRRSEIYNQIASDFRLLTDFTILSHDELRENARNMLDKFPDDLDEYFIEECDHFQDFVKNVELKEKFPSALLQLIRNKQLAATYPNMDIILRIILCMLCTNAAGE